MSFLLFCNPSAVDMISCHGDILPRVFEFQCTLYHNSPFDQGSRCAIFVPLDEFMLLKLGPIFHHMPHCSFNISMQCFSSLTLFQPRKVFVDICCNFIHSMDVLPLICIWSSSLIMHGKCIHLSHNSQCMIEKKDMY